MPGEMPDLWGDFQLEVLSPTMVLNAQAEKLKEKTQGLIIADFFALPLRENIRTLVFDIRAPAVGNYRERIMVVRQDADHVYPAVVTARPLLRENRPGTPPDNLFPLFRQIPESEWSFSVPCFNSTHFLSMIKVVLQSQEVQTTIESLLAKSNETKTGAYVRVVEDLQEKSKDD